MTMTTSAARTRDGSGGPTEGAAASAWLQGLVSGPPRALRAIGVSGPACYLRIADGDIVALEAPGGARLPNAVALDPTGQGVSGLAVGTAGRIGQHSVRIGARHIRVRRWWDARPHVGQASTRDLARRRDSLIAPPAPPHHTHGLAGPIAHLAIAAEQRDERALPTIVADLIGRGPGSTPAGDDVLAGLLATLRAFRVASDRDVVAFADALSSEIARATPRTTALSATLLRCADRGAVVACAGRVLRALAGHGAIEPAISGLLRLGHTSGRDLLAGMTIGVDVLTTERGRA